MAKYNNLVSKCNELTYIKLVKEYNELVQEIKYINDKLNEGWI